MNKLIQQLRKQFYSYNYLKWINDNLKGYPFKFEKIQGETVLTYNLEDKDTFFFNRFHKLFTEEFGKQPLRYSNKIIILTHWLFEYLEIDKDFVSFANKFKNKRLVKLSYKEYLKKNRRGNVSFEEELPSYTFYLLRNYFKFPIDKLIKFEKKVKKLLRKSK